MKVSRDDRRARRALRRCLGAALLLSLGASATAAATGLANVSGNLVRNGGAEIGGAAKDSSAVVAPAGWKTTEGFTAVAYSAGGGFPDAGASKAIAGGKHFFAGGPARATLRSSASQVDRVPAAFRKDGVTATLSAALGGYSTQNDTASVTATFLDATGSKLGLLRVGPVSRARRGGLTKLVPVTKKARLPAGTTSIEVVIAASAQRGGYKDGYADNIELRLSAQTTA